MAGTTTQAMIPKLRFREPIRNLPWQRTARTAESDLTIVFARAYTTQFRILHRRSTKNHMACAREIPVNGFGIADLVSVLWAEAAVPAGAAFDTTAEFLASARPTIRAFEVKLRDWRKAMMQANRYRYYSHVAVAVLPVDACRPALNYLDTFRTIRVGLWGFDTQSDRIVPYHTPSLAAPIVPRHAEEAITQVHRAARALPVR